jgi:hypothetical protein
MGIGMQRFVYIVHIADRNGILMSHMIHAHCCRVRLISTLDAA